MNLQEIRDKYETEEAFVAAVNAELRKLAEEQPDFRYNTSGDTSAGCFYHEGASDQLTGEKAGPECSGCIFGQALQRLGWTDAALAKGRISSVMAEAIRFSDESLDVWQDIQRWQDQGRTWAGAVALLDQ